MEIWCPDAFSSLSRLSECVHCKAAVLTGQLHRRRDKHRVWLRDYGSFCIFPVIYRLIIALVPGTLYVGNGPCN